MNANNIPQMNENQADTIWNEPIENLLHAIEVIVQLSENSNLSKELLKKAAKPIDYANKILKLTPIQMVLFSVFVDQCHDPHIRNEDIAEHLNCKRITILRHSNDIEELVKRKLIRAIQKKDETYYRVVPEVIGALTKNKNYTPPVLKDLNIHDFFYALSDLFKEFFSDDISGAALKDEIDELLQRNTHLEYVQKVNSYSLNWQSRMILVYFSHLHINDGDESFGAFEIDRMFSDLFRTRTIKTRLSNGDHELFNLKLLEFENNDGFADRSSYCFTQFAIKELFPELTIKKKKSRIIKLMKTHTTISSKKMYYNQQEGVQINQLTNLLKQEQFKQIQQRLADRGMRKGFACLFYGAPGTGKTETALQLARETGRDIIPVNVSEIKSMWVGESEKNIKELFDNYRLAVEDSDIAPILLFNEADAVLGIRQEGATSAVNKMENSIQNIILQEMETLEGIMIATTNLTQNLDKAFERRFLYKVKFEKPNIKAKQAIWLSMIPELSKKSALILAEMYDFSGGQIENIARKNSVDQILTGKKTTLKQLQEYCESENITKGGEGKRIGFR